MILPNFFYDWILFFIAVIIVNSVNYLILTMIFEFPIKYGILMSSAILTCLIYPLFSKLFNEKILLILRSEND